MTMELIAQVVGVFLLNVLLILVAWVIAESAPITVKFSTNKTVTYRHEILKIIVGVFIFISLLQIPLYLSASNTDCDYFINQTTYNGINETASTTTYTYSWLCGNASNDLDNLFTQNYGTLLEVMGWYIVGFVLVWLLSMVYNQYDDIKDILRRRFRK